MEIESISVGKKIRKIRELRNYTQEYMADQLGISIAGYSKIERGETKVDENRLTYIAKILEISPVELVDFDEKNVLNNFGANHHTVFAIHNHYSTKIGDLYENQISQLKEEILYLRGLVEKLSSGKK